jgi:hypothetical protein
MPKIKRSDAIKKTPIPETDISTSGVSASIRMSAETGSTETSASCNFDRSIFFNRLNLLFHNSFSISKGEIETQ